MKKNVLLLLCSFLLTSCELSNDWDGKPGVPFCQYCQGKGYFTKTDLLIFKTVYDCNCLERLKNYDYYSDESSDSEVSFKGRKYGECNYCDDGHKYIPKSGTTECVCDHSKHSHIGM